MTTPILIFGVVVVLLLKGKLRNTTRTVDFPQGTVKEKTARVFDEARLEVLLAFNALGPLDYLLQTTPDCRGEAGFGPSRADEVALSYGES